MSAGLFEKGPGSPVSKYALDVSRKECRAILRRIVDRHGVEKSAAACDLSESHLVQALSLKPGRNLDDHHIDALLVLGTDEERRDYFDDRQRPFGRCSQLVVLRTAEERPRDLEFRIAAKYGPSGVELVEGERSRP